MSELSEALERTNTLYRRLELESDRLLILAAARRQLALEPDECDEPGCNNGVWNVQGSIRNGEPCIACHGRGWLYKPETVEAVMDAALIPEPLAVAVLDALRALDQEAPR